MHICSLVFSTVHSLYSVWTFRWSAVGSSDRKNLPTPPYLSMIRVTSPALRMELLMRIPLAEWDAASAVPGHRKKIPLSDPQAFAWNRCAEESKHERHFISFFKGSKSQLLSHHQSVGKLFSFSVDVESAGTWRIFYIFFIYFDGQISSSNLIHKTLRNNGTLF